MIETVAEVSVVELVSVTVAPGDQRGRASRVVLSASTNAAAPVSGVRIGAPLTATASDLRGARPRAVAHDEGDRPAAGDVVTGARTSPR